MGVIDKLLGAAAGSTVGIAGQVLGGIASSIGAAKQIKETKRQAADSRIFNSMQQSKFDSLYKDLLGQAQNQSTYKGDTSAYNKMVSEAEKQKIEAATAVNPADAMMREDTRQSTANLIGAASRGARSGVDLMNIAGHAASQEAANMRGINTQNAQSSFSRQQNAGQTLIGSLGQLASATARERGLEYESMLQKQQNILNLTREGGVGSMDMAYRNQQEQLARRSAIVDAQASAWSGVGDVFRSVGQGFMNYNLANSQMDMLKTSAQGYGQSAPIWNYQNTNKGGTWVSPYEFKPNG